MSEKENSLTYELKIVPSSSIDKDEILNYLFLKDITSFVEGSVDNLFLDDNQDAFSNYDSLEKNTSSISIYKYSKEELLNIETDIKAQFGNRVLCSILSSNTDDWKYGWQSSFKPVVTKKFRVYPPWLEEDSSYLNIRIDPGMAFGTGQHESTKLCLQAIEYISDLSSSIKSCLDVGTGTGILAIAMKKLFSGASILATDIDIDAVTAVKRNAQDNGVSLDIEEGSVPEKLIQEGKTFDLVVANILLPVLKKIIVDVDKVTQPGSYYIIAGILEENVEEITKLYRLYNFSLTKTFYDNGWACCLFTKE